MLSSLVEAVLKTTRRHIKAVSKPEGEPGGGWIVVDFGDIVLHLFSPDQREYYQLEKLWDRGKILVRVQ